MFCADVLSDTTRWLEIWWRYGFIGPLLWHSPYAIALSRSNLLSF